MNSHRLGLYFIVFLLVFGYIGLLFTGEGEKRVIVDAPPSFFTQEECEAQTESSCHFVQCDYIPEGKTFEEVCGRGFREGWQSVEHGE